MSDVRPWPETTSEGRWAIGVLEELLQSPDESPEELRERAHELRDEAERTEIPGHAEVALALADRYEQAR
jgi:hypothetical protein